MIYADLSLVILVVFICTFIKLAEGKSFKVILNVFKFKNILQFFYLVKFQRLNKFLFSFVIFVRVSEFTRVK